MKNFLTKKWLGPLILFLYTLCISLFVVHTVTPYLKEAFPIVMRESNNFLPITIQNGEITQPENAFIHRAYNSSHGEAFHVILDTRTDQLDLRTLPNNGFYVSKKCWYTASPEETKVKCMEPGLPTEPVVITNEMIQDWLTKADKYAGIFLGSCLTIALFIGLYFIILFYTLIMHWVVALFFKTTFGQTLFVNTLIYMICSLLEMMTPIDIGFLVKIVLFICVNILLCRVANERKKKEVS